MCDQPRSEARSPRCEDEEAQKKDPKETNKGQSYSWHQIGLCAPDRMAPDKHCALDKASPYFSREQ